MLRNALATCTVSRRAARRRCVGPERHRLAGRAAAMALAALCSIAAPAAQEDDGGRGDPLEPLNRKVLVFNYVADRVVLRPAGHAYRAALPRFLRGRVRNFIDNLDEPRTALNQLLQGRRRAAASDAGRFVLNTTVGLGSLFDPATAAGLERHREDFGQTLVRWGVPRGPALSS